MTTTQTASKITYRRTKTGEWVAFAPLAVAEQAYDNDSPIIVSKKDGTTKSETIAKLGRPFVVDGIQMVYCYLAPKGSHRPGGNTKFARSYNGGGCPTDGDCWSFGWVKSCHECGK